MDRISFWLKLCKSLFIKILLIFAILLIPLLLTNSQVKAENPVIVSGSQINIYVGSGTQQLYYAGGPHSFVAFDSIHKRFLVVWEDLQIDTDVYGQMVNIDGTLYGSPIPISTLSGSQQMGPMPIFDPTGGRFLVIWCDTRGGIYGQFVDSNGTLWGGNFSISGQWSGGNFIAFDSTNNKFLVLWSTGPAAPYNLMARFVNTDGSLPSLPFQITNYTSGYGLWRYAATYDSNHTRFLIVYGNGDDGYTYGRLLNSDGTPYTAPFLISPNGVESITFDPIHNRFLVINRGRKGQLVKADGTLDGVEFDIADYPAGVTSSVYDGIYDKFLVVGDTGGSMPIFGQLVHSDGSLHDLEAIILDTRYHSPLPPYTAGYSGQFGFLVVWSDEPYSETGSDIFGKIVRIVYKTYLPTILKY